MLISAKNILSSSQQSALSGQRLEIELPLSKSESNRALMIMHYARTLEFLNSKTLENSRVLNFKSSRILELSNSDDTVLLQKHLNTLNKYLQDPKSVDYCPLTLELDCHNAGTVFRFLMTAVAVAETQSRRDANLTVRVDSQSQSQSQESESTVCVLLTGSERMKNRPIDSLVEALRSLGVVIEYKGREGYPPILVRGGRIEGGRVEVSAEQSSQFASSLLLAAPLWKNGLELHLTGNLSSLPYIDMTISMMRQCGIDVVRNERDITVKPGRYNIENIKVEPDWSAAAFWYEMASFSDDAEILLKNLNINSLQADAAAIEMFETLGVETITVEGGVVVGKTTRQQDNKTTRFVDAETQSLKDAKFEVNGQRSASKSTVGVCVNSRSLCQQSVSESTFNFKDCPDLFPAVIAACAGNGVDATFAGLKNLSIKESDRKHAMMNELSKIGISFEDVSDDELKMFCPEKLPYFSEENPIVFNNYGDHRIAMALSLLSMKIGAISMENIDVVSKSYPRFFEDSCILRLCERE